MEIKHIGLTDGQVRENREKFGANIITPPPKKTLWKEYLEKFGDPLIIILLIAGALSPVDFFYEYFWSGQDGRSFF